MKAERGAGRMRVNIMASPAIVWLLVQGGLRVKSLVGQTTLSPDEGKEGGPLGCRVADFETST